MSELQYPLHQVHTSVHHVINNLILYSLLTGLHVWFEPSSTYVLNLCTSPPLRNFFLGILVKMSFTFVRHDQLMTRGLDLLSNSFAFNDSIAIGCMMTSCLAGF